MNISLLPNLEFSRVARLHLNNDANHADHALSVEPCWLYVGDDKPLSVFFVNTTSQNLQYDQKRRRIDGYTNRLAHPHGREPVAWHRRR